MLNTEIRQQVKYRTRDVAQEKHLEHVKGLQVQGNFLTLAAEENQDILWKSTMSGTLKFMMNASIDTLPTSANFKRWKYSSSDQ